MPEVFDLTKIKRLIDSTHPSAIVIVDTNVVIKAPNFETWKTSLSMPIFVLPDVIILELEHLRNKQRNKQKGQQMKGEEHKHDSEEVFTTTIASVHQLFRKGNISNGILMDGVGWFISIPSPKEDSLKREITQLESVEQAFGRSDVTMLVLARELNQSVPNTPSVFATADKNLFNIVAANGIPAYAFEGSPMTGLDGLVGSIRITSIDWTAVVYDVQKATQDRSIQVDLTLRAKKMAPAWSHEMIASPPNSQTLVAEGSGVLHSPEKGRIGLSWSILFKPWDFPFSKASGSEDQGESMESSIDGPQPSEYAYLRPVLDFGGLQGDVSAALQKAVGEKISDCASPYAWMDGMRTIQDPISVMKAFLHIDYLARNTEHQSFDDASNDLGDLITRSGHWEDFLEFWLLDPSIAEESEQSTSQDEFFNAMTSCWSLGQTVQIKIIIDTDEPDLLH